MNVIISMTYHNVLYVEHKIKTIILRRYIPSGFNINEDVVYIVEKKTYRIALICKLEGFHESSKETNLWQRYGREMGVTRTMWEEYFVNGSNICLWVIKQVFKPDRIALFRSVFTIKYPPANVAFTSICQDICEKSTGATFLPLWERIEEGKNAVQ